jgi:hypothetical protein
MNDDPQEAPPPPGRPPYPQSRPADRPPPDTGARPRRRCWRRTSALVGIGCAAMVFAPKASADPTTGHDANVKTQTPPMLCEVGDMMLGTGMSH